MGEKWEDRNRFQITAGQHTHRVRMAGARLDLFRAIIDVEQKYDLTIMEMLSLLNSAEESFQRSGLEYEEKERWEEEANGIQKNA